MLTHGRGCAAALLYGFFLCFCSQASAKDIYVTDKIIIELYSERFEQGQLLKSLPTGTVLSVLQKQEDYTLIRTQDGIEGWVRSIQLTNEKPAQLEYLELLAKQKILNEKLHDYEDRLLQMQELKKQVGSTDDLRVALANHKVRVETLENNLKNKDLLLGEEQQKRQALQLELTQTKAQLKEVLQSIKIQAEQTGVLPALGFGAAGEQELGHNSNQAVWLVVSLVVTLLIGVLLGFVLIDYRIRRRHGGVRIY